MGWGKPTYRQMRTWLYWSEEHFDDPDILCYYLMQMTRFVHGLGSGKTSSISSYRIKLRRAVPKTREERINDSKAAWIGGMGKKVRHVIVQPGEPYVNPS